jgi:hypothetical protein
MTLVPNDTNDPIMIVDTIVRHKMTCGASPTANPIKVTMLAVNSADIFPGDARRLFRRRLI